MGDPRPLPLRAAVRAGWSLPEGRFQPNTTLVLKWTSLTGASKVPGLTEGSGSPVCLWTVVSLKVCVCSLPAPELPPAGHGLPHQAAAAGLALLGHSQLRHATARLLAQTVAQPARQILQVSPESSHFFCSTVRIGGGGGSVPQPRRRTRSGWTPFTDHLEVLTRPSGCTRKNQAFNLKKQLLL